LWNIQERSLLYITISRYLKKKILYPIYKGLYSTLPVDQLNPLELGRSIIHSYTYLSTESVLALAGIISQIVFEYTFIANQSKKVTIGDWTFRYRQMKDEYLFNPIGISQQAYGLSASVERSVADLLYYNPHYHFDIVELIDFEKVDLIQKEVGYG